ncbi:hypothetical protein ONZ45_g18336 [Pleurotus djamor]|nr:hypothetical protein ONZ45_g18336 [Pleurotus djamor]
MVSTLALCGPEPEGARQREDALALPVPRIYVNRLTPAPDVEFWSRQEFTIFSNRRLHDPTNSSNFVTVDWRCTAHIYTTGARPDSSNFAGLGGVVYIVLVHQGHLDSTLIQKTQDVTLTMQSTSATPGRQLPVFSTENGNHWRAQINYGQRFQMFRFGGNALEPFEAEYIHEFQLERMEQTGRTYNDRMEMHFRPLPFSNWQTRRELNGLSVFWNTRPQLFPLRFRFDAVATFNNDTARASSNVDIPLGFRV